MTDKRDIDILLNEYSHMWEYYNKIQENNQRLYENYFKAVSAFGAVLAVSAAILNSDVVTVDLSYQMILIGMASIIVIGLGFVGYNSIITFAREVGNSEIYLANLKDIRTYLWESTPKIEASVLVPIHDLRKPIESKSSQKVSDARIQIFIALNSFVLATGIFIFLFAMTYAAILTFGSPSAGSTYLPLIFATSLIFGVLAIYSLFKFQRRKANKTRHNYVKDRLG